nr:hypothetical protein Iba_chr05eCG11010 [Ipomoea batatas]
MLAGVLEQAESIHADKGRGRKSVELGGSSKGKPGSSSNPKSHQFGQPPTRSARNGSHCNPNSVPRGRGRPLASACGRGGGRGVSNHSARQLD